MLNTRTTHTLEERVKQETIVNNRDNDRTDKIHQLRKKTQLGTQTKSILNIKRDSATQNFNGKVVK